MAGLLQVANFGCMRTPGDDRPPPKPPGPDTPKQGGGSPRKDIEKTPEGTTATGEAGSRDTGGGKRVGVSSLTPENMEALDDAIARSIEAAKNGKPMNAFEVSITTPEGTRIEVLSDAKIVDGRLVVYDMATYENPARTIRRFRLTEDAGEYLGQRARELGLEGVQFRGVRTGGAIGKRGTEMVKDYPRGG